MDSCQQFSRDIAKLIASYIKFDKPWTLSIGHCPSIIDRADQDVTSKKLVCTEGPLLFANKDDAESFLRARLLKYCRDEHSDILTSIDGIALWDSEGKSSMDWTGLEAAFNDLQFAIICARAISIQSTNDGFTLRPFLYELKEVNIAPAQLPNAASTTTLALEAEKQEKLDVQKSNWFTVLSNVESMGFSLFD